MPVEKRGGFMVIAGIVGRGSKMHTATLINFILSAKDKKVSVIDMRNLMDVKPEMLKDYFLELTRNKTDFLLLKINIYDQNKEILDSIHFDVMIYDDKADDIREADPASDAAYMRRLFTLLDKKGTAIVNADNAELIRMLEGMEHYTVTYGFNPKASVTTSSVGDEIYKDNFMCCLQRTVSTRNGGLVEPQEYKVNIGSRELDNYNVLAAASFAIVNGVDLNSLDPIKLETMG